MQRDILLAVAGMNGIEDTSLVTPAWLRGGSKGGVSKAAAQAIMCAVRLKVLKGGALAVIPIGLDEIERLAR